MNIEEEIWNPTRRLYEALAQGRLHAQTLQANGHPKPIRKVLGNVFGVNPNSTFDIYRGLQ
jgi:hypothetical protein